MKHIFIYLSSLSILSIALSGEHLVHSGKTNHLDHTDHHSGHDGHQHQNIPIGVMGAHSHEKGKTMLSYRYMFMDMGPNYIGDEKAGLGQILGAPNGDTTFPIIPTEMQTQMQMLGIMHGLTDRITLSAMLMYVDKSMQHTFIDGSTFRTHSSGIGDFKFGGLVKIFDENDQQLLFNFMTSAPLGSVDNEGFVPPAGGSVRLPYPMQLGSGTWDLMPGLTWLAQRGDLSFGAQAMATIRTGENDEGYTFGDDFMVTGWTAYQLTDSLSTSFRASYKIWDNIEGADPNLNPLVVPTARTDLRGGERIDLFGGVNYDFHQGLLRSTRLAVEAGGSVWQDLDGPQLGMDWSITTGLQKTF